MPLATDPLVQNQEPRNTEPLLFASLWSSGPALAINVRISRMPVYLGVGFGLRSNRAWIFLAVSELILRHHWKGLRRDDTSDEM